MESDLNTAAARGTQGEGRPSLDNEPETADAGPLRLWHRPGGAQLEGAYPIGGEQMLRRQPG